MPSDTMYKLHFAIGDQDRTGQPVSPPRLKQAVIFLGGLLRQTCGGAQVSKHVGLTTNGAGQPIWEGTVTLWAYTTADPEAWLPALCHGAALVAEFLNQEAVLLTVEEFNTLLP